MTTHLNGRATRRAGFARRADSRRGPGSVGVARSAVPAGIGIIGLGVRLPLGEALYEAWELVDPGITDAARLRAATRPGDVASGGFCAGATVGHRFAHGPNPGAGV